MTYRNDIAIQKAYENSKGNASKLKALFDKDQEFEPQRLDSGDSQHLAALKLAYRKHALDDDSIGWGEVQNAMWDVICNEMGDDAANAWADKHRNNIEET